MTHIAGFERSQLLLLPEAIDDYVGADNPVRFIDAVVDGLDLKAAGFWRVEAKATDRFRAFREAHGEVGSKFLGGIGERQSSPPPRHRRSSIRRRFHTVCCVFERRIVSYRLKFDHRPVGCYETVINLIREKGRPSRKLINFGVSVNYEPTQSQDRRGRDLPRHRRRDFGAGLVGPS